LISAKLERDIDRLHALPDASTKRRINLNPDPRVFWAADFQQPGELVRLTVERVTVMPGRASVGRFNASRVSGSTSGPSIQRQLCQRRPMGLSMARLNGRLGSSRNGIPIRYSAAPPSAGESRRA
jgi:hypothetical protein